jgi:hypothetical protein
MNEIKGIIYGLGQMGRILARLSVEKGVIPVGAIDMDPAAAGKDLGELAGFSYPLNVKVSDNADEVLSQNEADIALIAVFAELDRSFPLFKRCIENGVNVITTCDESLFPWTTSPEITAKLDKLAKRHGVTIVGAGFQDTFLANEIILLSGASHTIEIINGHQSYNIDDYGPVVAEWHNLGETLDEFRKREQEEGMDLSYFVMSLETIAAGLGLTIKNISQHTEPLTSETDLYCKSLDKKIPGGRTIGRTQITDIDTWQGIKLHGEEVSKVYMEGEVDEVIWSIKGEPDTFLRNDRVATRFQTCTQMVNRIPDVINSEPGYVTVNELPMLRYRAYPLHFYVNERGRNP